MRSGLRGESEQAVRVSGLGLRTKGFGFAG